MSLLDEEEILCDSRKSLKKGAEEWVKRNIAIKPIGIEFIHYAVKLLRGLDETLIPQDFIERATRFCDNESSNILNSIKLYSYFEVTDNLEINIMGRLNFKEHVKEFPYKFKHVVGHFNLSNTQIQSLHNCPDMVMGGFSCKECQNLISLKGCPRIILSVFYANNCKNLKRLEWEPIALGDSFELDNPERFAEEFKNIKTMPKVPNYQHMQQIYNTFHCYESIR